MPEEIPWNSSVYPEKASPRVPREAGEPPILNLPQRDVPRRYGSGLGPSSLARDVTRQPTGPLRANPFPPNFNQPWHPNQPDPFNARPAPAFPPVQPIRFAPQVTPAPARPFPPAQTPLPTRPMPTPARFVLPPTTPLPYPSRPASRHGAARPPAPASGTPRRFTEVTDQSTPIRMHRPLPVQPGQTGNMARLNPAWPRQTLPPMPAPVYPARPVPEIPRLFEQEERNQPAGLSLANQHTQPLPHISTSAMRRAARASLHRLLFVATLSFLLAMMLGAALVNIRQQALATSPEQPLPYFPYHGSLVLNDPLHQSSASWQVGQSGPQTCTFQNGSYHVLATRHSALAACRAQGLILSNFALQVKMTLLSGDRGGLVFRLSQRGGYFFSLDRRGHYSLVAFNNKSSTSLLSGTSEIISSAQTYLLAVVAIGQQIDLYVNQQPLASMYDPSFTAGAIAAGAQDVSQPTAVTFSAIAAWKL